jgi:OmpA-OmpF porin, OOP family
MNSKTVLGFGIPIFLLFCFLCIWMHGPSAAGNLAAVAPAAALASPTLDARYFDNKVILSGNVSSQAEKDQILAKATELYGTNKFEDKTVVVTNKVEGGKTWLPAALLALPLATKANNEGGFLVENGSLTVRGLVESDAAKAALMAEAAKTLAPNMKLIDKVIVKGKITDAQASDFQAKLNEMMVGKIVEFETGSDKLTTKGQSTLDEMVKVLAQVPGVPVEVGGHTDSSGNASSNLSLSQRRAAACRKYLSEHGVAADRMSAKGYGATKPIAGNNTAEEKARNRRTEFLVVKEAK